MPRSPVVVTGVVVVVVVVVVEVEVGAVLVAVWVAMVTVVPEGVVGEDLPPVSPIPRLSSSDWGCKLIHDRTSVWFS